MQEAFEMVTSKVFHGQFTNDPVRGYLRHTEVITLGACGPYQGLDLERIPTWAGQGNEIPLEFGGRNAAVSGGIPSHYNLTRIARDSRLARKHFLQRPFDAIEFFTNDTDRLLVSGSVRMG